MKGKNEGEMVDWEVKETQDEKIRQHFKCKKDKVIHCKSA